MSADAKENLLKKEEGQESIVLVDGSGFIFRAFHGLPPMTRADGTPVNAVLGFTNMLWKMLRDSKANYFAEYKANRPPPPEELIPQFALVREATRAFNIKAVELPGFEADDLIATYTRQACNAGMKVTIVSSDKDLMQLVNDDRVKLFDHFKNKEIEDNPNFEVTGDFALKTMKDWNNRV